MDVPSDPTLNPGTAPIRFTVHIRYTVTPPNRPTPVNLKRRSRLAGEAAAAAAEVENSLAVDVDETGAAFFDVDNTVMQGASIFHLARGLHRREFFTTRDILGAAWKQAYFRLVGVEDIAVILA